MAKDNKKRDAEKGKKQEKKKEDVILMGAPRNEVKSLPKEADVKKRIEQKNTAKRGKQKDESEKAGVKIEFDDTVAHTTAKKEELPKIESKTETVNAKEHVGLGKIFLALIGLFVAYLIVGQIFNFFGPTSISLISLWPLLLILIGFSLFKVKKKSYTHVLGYLLVLVVFFASVILVFKGGDIVTIQVTDEVVTEERGVDPFTEIVFDGRGTLSLTQGDREAVIITADDAVVEEMVLEQDGERLHIGYGNMLWSLFLFEETAIDVEVITRDIASVDIAGIADAEINNVTADTLDVVVSGSGSTTLSNVAVDELVLRVNGVGEIEVAGQSERTFIVVSGSGAVTATDLESNEAAVRVSGVGDVILSVSDQLDASVEGRGEVVYLGNPEITSETAEDENVYSEEAMRMKLEMEEVQEESAGDSAEDDTIKPSEDLLEELDTAL